MGRVLPVVLSPMELTNVMIQAKYLLWNRYNRPEDDVNVWFGKFLDEDRQRARGKRTNFAVFKRACKEIHGGIPVFVTLADVWRSVAMAHLNMRMRH